MKYYKKEEGKKMKYFKIGEQVKLDDGLGDRDFDVRIRWRRKRKWLKDKN